MIYMKNSQFSFVQDLKRFFDLSDHMHTFSSGDGYLCWSTCVLSSDHLSASECVQSYGHCPPSTAQSQRFQLLGSIPGFGFCSTDNSRIFVRYRDKSAGVKKAFLSYGSSLQDHFEKHFGQRQSRQTVGSFCRFGASFD